jgi:hypothetical protein
MFDATVNILYTQLRRRGDMQFTPLGVPFLFRAIVTLFCVGPSELVFLT